MMVREEDRRRRAGEAPDSGQRRDRAAQEAPDAGHAKDRVHQEAPDRGIVDLNQSGMGLRR